MRTIILRDKMWSLETGNLSTQVDVEEDLNLYKNTLQYTIAGST